MLKVPTSVSVDGSKDMIQLKVKGYRQGRGLGAVFSFLVVMMMASCADGRDVRLKMDAQRSDAGNVGSPLKDEIDFDDQSAREAVVSYLVQRYDEMVEYRDGSSGIVGLAYLPKTHELLRIETEFTKTAFPHTRYYLAKLTTPFFEYRSVGVVVSIRKVGKKLDIRSSVAADYAEPSGRFLQQFADASDGSWVTMRAVAVEVANLLSKCGRDGRARPKEEGRAGQAELWMNSAHIGDILVSQEPASNQNVASKVVVVRFRRPPVTSSDSVRSRIFK